MRIITRLRSQLDKRYAGSGITYAYKEDIETYKDKKVKSVRMPHDYSSIYNYKNLASEVKPYKLTPEELEYYRNTYK